MDIKKYKKIRAAIAIFVASIVSVSVTIDSYLLAIITVLTGMLFMILVRSKTKVVIDEREVSVREKAANLTYAIFTPVLGIGSFLLLLPSYGGIPVFSKGDFIFLESLGMVFAYLTLFLIAVYSISYFYLNRKFGGGKNDK
jgi:uncharacterized membrane protein